MFLFPELQTASCKRPAQTPNRFQEEMPAAPPAWGMGGELGAVGKGDLPLQHCCCISLFLLEGGRTNPWLPNYFFTFFSIPKKQ